MQLHELYLQGKAIQEKAKESQCNCIVSEEESTEMTSEDEKRCREEEFRMIRDGLIEELRMATNQ